MLLFLSSPEALLGRSLLLLLSERQALLERSLLLLLLERQSLLGRSVLLLLSERQALLGRSVLLLLSERQALLGRSVLLLLSGRETLLGRSLLLLLSERQASRGRSALLHLSGREHSIVDLVVNATASRASDLGSIPAFAVGPFAWSNHTSDFNILTQWLPYQAPGVLGSALELVGPGSDRKFDLQLLSFSVTAHKIVRADSSPRYTSMLLGG